MRITDNKQKREIIESLQREKLITFEEALLLLEIEVEKEYVHLPPISINPFPNRWDQITYAADKITVGGL